MGLAPVGCAKILHIEIISTDSVSVTFEHASGIDKRLVSGEEAENMQVIVPEPHWELAGVRPTGTLYRLVTEATRIRNAHHFDRYLALQTSAIEPLPHQITAVYEEMLPRQPLRYLLADDPGSGKTIMSGIYIKELLARSDCDRCLIVAPGNLAEQWQEELWEKFKLDFELLSRDMIGKSRASNPFNVQNHLIVRLDVLARNKGELQHMFEHANNWDLIICDEAHRMSASFYGDKLDKTKRYQLGEKLSMKTRNLLFLTATPHCGKEEDFKLLMALLDDNLLPVQSRSGISGIETKNMIRRLIKEDLLTFDGAPLFPARHAYTVSYRLSDKEQYLYDRVTEYIRYESNLVERCTSDDSVRRRINVNFALQVLQRRMASSSNAAYQSLKRRRMRLEERLAEMRDLDITDQQAYEQRLWTEEEISDLNDLSESEYAETEERIAASVTSDNTVNHLHEEVAKLRDLEDLAKKLLESNRDTKWLQLKGVLNGERMVDETGKRRKLIIFTESRDTLDYLVCRVQSQLTHTEQLEVIHGGIAQPKRRDIMDRFLHDSDLAILIATDAAGEGVNLQSSHLMVNYDLPWNPNRIEQRFGRIHRIGQTEECHLWNLVAKSTREGKVYLRLLTKLQAAREELNGKVYDVLGQLLEGDSLEDLLWEAIKHGKDERTMAKYLAHVDHKVNIERIKELLERNKLTDNIFHKEHIDAIRSKMRLADIQSLQPYYIQSFFEMAFEQLGGRINVRSNEQGRYSIKHVPARIRQVPLPNDATAQVRGAYDRICFDKQYVDPIRGDRFKAEHICPGHPLLDATVCAIKNMHSKLHSELGIMVDATGDFDCMQVIYMLELVFKDGRYNSNDKQHVVEKMLRFVRVDSTGAIIEAGFSPHLNLRGATAEEMETVGRLTLAEKWLNPSLDKKVRSFAADKLVQPHRREIELRVAPIIDKKMKEVRSRLRAEIKDCLHREHEISERASAGKKPKQNFETVQKRRIECEKRLHERIDQLDLERQISSADPRILARMIVIPSKLLKLQSEHGLSDLADGHRVSTAMKAVIAAETSLCRIPQDVSGQMLGYDVITTCPTSGRAKYIKVACIDDDSEAIIARRTEILASLNMREDYILAVVRIGRDNETSTQYVEMPFGSKLPPFETAVQHFPIRTLLNKAKDPH